MTKNIFISIITIIIYVEIAFGQTKPSGMYVARTLYHSVPATDVNGFTSFKFQTGERPKGKYCFVFYNDHITVKIAKYVSLRINKIDTKYSDDIKYFVTDPQGKHYQIIVYKNETGVYDSIDYFTLDKKGNPATLTKVILRNPPKLAQ